MLQWGQVSCGTVAEKPGKAGKAGLSWYFCTTDICRSYELAGNPRLLCFLLLHGTAALCLCVTHKQLGAGATLINLHILTKAVSACICLGRFLGKNLLAQISVLHLISKMYFLTCLVTKQHNNNIPNNIKILKRIKPLVC